MYSVLAFLIAVAVIALLIKLFKIDLGLSLFLGTSLFGLLVYTPKAFFEKMVSALFSGTTLGLIMAATSILVFVNFYSKSGLMDQLNEFLKLRRPKLSLILVPAVLALLPVAGGALLSAPFVQKEGEELGLNRPKLVYINIWFRHSVQVGYPLENTLIVAAALTSFTVLDLSFVLLPIVIFMILLGYLVGLRGIDGRKIEMKKADIYSFIPLIIAITAGSALSKLSVAGIALGTFMGIVAIGVKKGWSSLKKATLDKNLITIFLVVYAAMLMRELSLTSTMGKELVALEGILPLPMLYAIISFFLGFMIGYPMAAVVLSLSLLLSHGPITLLEAALVYASGFIGYISSPFHLCVLFTVKYMKARLLESYKYLIPSALLSFVLLMAYFFFLTSL